MTTLCWHIELINVNKRFMKKVINFLYINIITDKKKKKKKKSIDFALYIDSKLSHSMQQKQTQNWSKKKQSKMAKIFIKTLCLSALMMFLLFVSSGTLHLIFSFILCLLEYVMKIIITKRLTTAYGSNRITEGEWPDVMSWVSGWRSWEYMLWR